MKKILCFLGMHEWSYVKTFYQIVDICCGPESVIDGWECDGCGNKKYKGSIAWYANFTLDQFLEIFPSATNEYLNWKNQDE